MIISTAVCEGLNLDGKAFISNLYRGLGLKDYQQQIAGHLLGIKATRLQVWRQRASIPDRAIIIFSIQLSVPVDDLLDGRYDSLKPRGRYDDIDAKLDETGVMDCVAKAYGYDNAKHLEFVRQMRERYGGTFNTWRTRNSLPVTMVLDAHRELHLSVESIVFGVPQLVEVTPVEVEADKVPLTKVIKTDASIVKVVPFRDFLQSAYFGDPYIAARVNDVAKISISNWSKSRVVINGGLWTPIRSLNGVVNDHVHSFEAAGYSVADYVSKFCGGRISELAARAGVSRQTGDLWLKSRKLIVNETVYSWVRDLVI